MRGERRGPSTGGGWMTSAMVGARVRPCWDGGLWAGHGDGCGQYGSSSGQHDGRLHWTGWIYSEAWAGVRLKWPNEATQKGREDGMRRQRTKWPRQPGRVRDRLSMMLVPTMGLGSFSEREPLLSPTRHVSVPAPTAHVMRTDHLARRGLQLVPASVRAGLQGAHTADGVHTRAHDSGRERMQGSQRIWPASR